MAEKNGKKLSALDRAIQTAMGEGRHVGADDDPAAKKYPQLWEWLSRIYLPGDLMRQPSSLTITLTPTGVQVSVYDRDIGQSVVTTCAHLDDAIKTMEEELNKDNPQIRNSGKKEPQLRRRKRPHN
jgi:hypothetical protein